MKWLLVFCPVSNILETVCLGAAGHAPSYDPTELLLNVRKKVVATVDVLLMLRRGMQMEGVTTSPSQ